MDDLVKIRIRSGSGKETLGRAFADPANGRELTHGKISLFSEGAKSVGDIGSDNDDSFRRFPDRLLLKSGLGNDVDRPDLVGDDKSGLYSATDDGDTDARPLGQLGDRAAVFEPRIRERAVECAAARRGAEFRVGPLSRP